MRTPCPKRACLRLSDKPTTCGRPVPQRVTTGGQSRSIGLDAVVWLAIAAFIVFFSWLSILRHESFGSGAMDLGYTDQVVWNTLHGRPMRFSTFENASIDLPLATFRRTDTLLAFHVELILAPISLLYLIYDSPITLLLLQTVGMALGAWPAFRLAREHLGSDTAGIIFALAYLLAPAIQGATMSDFHATSLTASVFLFALFYLERRRFVPFFILMVVALLSKEDLSLMVFMIGGYLYVCLRERRLGLIAMAVALSWLVICTQVILPHFSGLASSPFLDRLAIFGPTLRESINCPLREPLLLVRWLSRPEIISYLLSLLAITGFTSLFCPSVLMLCAPAVGINVFSNWNWTYSGGEHYSASIVPFVLVSGIYGTASIARRLSRWRHLPYRRTATTLALFVLAVAGATHYHLGISPPARVFRLPKVTTHHRLGKELLGLIPPGASVSAQSNLYPHLTHRERAYFYPAVNDAEYVMLDVTSTSYPLTVKGSYLQAKQLLRSGDFGVLAAEDGYLLMRRGLTPTLDGELPRSFYTFARHAEPTLPNATTVHFGDALALVGYECSWFNLVQIQHLPVIVTTYWRPLRSLSVDYQFSFFFTRKDGAIVYQYADGTPTTIWYPPHHWKEGEVIRMETPVLTVGRLRDALVGVVPPAKDPWNAAERLEVQPMTADHSSLVDGGTLLRLFSFP